MKLLRSFKSFRQRLGEDLMTLVEPVFNKVRETQVLKNYASKINEWGKGNPNRFFAISLFIFALIGISGFMSPGAPINIPTTEDLSFVDKMMDGARTSRSVIEDSKGEILMMIYDYSKGVKTLDSLRSVSTWTKEDSALAFSAMVKVQTLNNMMGDETD